MSDELEHGQSLTGNEEQIVMNAETGKPADDNNDSPGLPIESDSDSENAGKEPSFGESSFEERPLGESYAVLSNSEYDQATSDQAKELNDEADSNHVSHNPTSNEYDDNSEEKNRVESVESSQPNDDSSSQHDHTDHTSNDDFDSNNPEKVPSDISNYNEFTPENSPFVSQVNTDSDKTEPIQEEENYTEKKQPTDIVHDNEDTGYSPIEHMPGNIQEEKHYTETGQPTDLYDEDLLEHNHNNNSQEYRPTTDEKNYHESETESRTETEPEPEPESEFESEFEPKIEPKIEPDQLIDTNIHNSGFENDSPKQNNSPDILDDDSSSESNPIQDLGEKKDYESKIESNQPTNTDISGSNINSSPNIDESEFTRDLYNEKKTEHHRPTSKDYKSNVINFNMHATMNESEVDVREKRTYEIETEPIRSTSTKIRKRPVSQHHQEPSSSSDNNITSIKNSNVKVDKDKAQLSIASILKYVLGFTLLSASLYFIYDNQFNNKSYPLRKLAFTTSSLFEEINGVELPDVKTIKDHTIKCRVAANTIGRTVSFKSYGTKIEEGLRVLGNTIYDTSSPLQKMYSKGSYLLTLFENEIGSTTQRLNSNPDSHYLSSDDVKYIKNRLFKLISKIKELRESVGKVHNSILGAEKVRNSIESNIQDGLREAETYINNEKHSASIDKAKKEIAIVDDTLSELHTNAVNLDNLTKILWNHEQKLLDVSDELGDENGKISKKDIRLLNLAIENSKGHHNKFNKLAQISD